MPTHQLPVNVTVPLGGTTMKVKKFGGGGGRPLHEHNMVKELTMKHYKKITTTAVISL